MGEITLTKPASPLVQIDVNGKGKKQCSISFEANPAIGSSPRGLLKISTGKAEMSFYVYTANVSREGAQEMAENIVRLDSGSLNSLIGGIEKESKNFPFHLLDLPQQTLACGLNSTRPEIQAHFSAIQQKNQKREREWQEIRDREAIQSYRASLSRWICTPFDPQKDADYFALAPFQSEQIHKDPKLYPFLERVRSGASNDVWQAIPRALWFENHPHHTATVLALSSVIDGMSYEEAIEVFGKLGDDVYYLYHHGDIEDCILDRLQIKPRSPIGTLVMVQSMGELLKERGCSSRGA